MEAPNFSPSSFLQRNKFISTFNHRQNWSLPASIIYFITKNPSTSKCYQKMIQCCKYFFIKNPIIILRCFHLEYDEFYTCLNKKCCFPNTKLNININSFLSKIWVEQKLNCEIVTNQNLISQITPKLFNANFHSLNISDQILTFDEFLFLSSQIKKIKLYESTVIYGNGNVVEFEKLVQSCPNVESFTCSFLENSPIISTKTAKELSNFLPTSRIKSLKLFELTENFDIKTFFNEFLKKNKKISIELFFCGSLSDDYIDKLEDVLCEIVEAEKFEYSPPYIFLPGLDDAIQNVLYDIADSNNFF